MTYGVIDVGSNTIRLCIYNVSRNRLTPLFSNKTTAGLADYVSDGELSRKGIKKACSTLSYYKDMADTAGIEDLYVFATASLRNITNSDEAVSAIEEETGLKIDLLSGEQEAKLDFLGASFSKSMKQGIMVDIGGGSTEIVVYKNGKIKEAVSLEFGSLYMFKNYVSRLFPTKSERKEIEKRVKGELKNLKSINDKRFEHMIGIGGTIRAVKKMNDYRFEVAPADANDVISIEHLKMLSDECKAEERQLLKKILRTSPDRVHTLIPGMIILTTICDFYGVKEIEVSGFGVREGYLSEKVKTAVESVDNRDK